MTNFAPVAAYRLETWREGSSGKTCACAAAGALMPVAEGAETNGRRTGERMEADRSALGGREVTVL